MEGRPVGLVLIGLRLQALQASFGVVPDGLKPAFTIEEITKQALAVSPTFRVIYQSVMPAGREHQWTIGYADPGYGSQTLRAKQIILIDRSVTPSEAIVELMYEVTNASNKQYYDEVARQLRDGKFKTGEEYARATIAVESGTVVTACEMAAQANLPYYPAASKVVQRHLQRNASGELDWKPPRDASINAANREVFDIVWQTAQAKDDAGALRPARDVYGAQWEAWRKLFQPAIPKPSGVRRMLNWLVRTDSTVTRPATSFALQAGQSSRRFAMWAGDRARETELRLMQQNTQRFLQQNQRIMEQTTLLNQLNLNLTLGQAHQSIQTSLAEHQRLVAQTQETTRQGSLAAQRLDQTLQAVQQHRLDQLQATQLAQQLHQQATAHTQQAQQLHQQLQQVWIHQRTPQIIMGPPIVNPPR